MNILLISLSAFVLLIIIWFIATYNSLIGLKNYVEEAFSTMDVYLKKRFDMIPSLVDMVKGYSLHEKEVLDNITNLRSQAYSILSNDKKMELNQKLDTSLSRLIALSENYPELKANQNFLELQRQLENIENDIAQSRKYYNGTVREFNTKIQLFPTVIIASMFGFRAQKLFEADNIEREKPGVSF